MTDTAPAIYELKFLQERLERLDEQYQRAMRTGTFRQAASLQMKISELMERRDSIKRYLGEVLP